MNPVEYSACSICCSKMVGLITVNMSQKTKYAIELWHVVSHFFEHHNNSKEKEIFSLLKSLNSLKFDSHRGRTVTYQSSLKEETECQHK